jgi:uroporphyrinogen decarboxylase
MDIGTVKQKYGKRLCLIGKIDCAYILSEPSTEEVAATIKECILKASPGGGHIITSSDPIYSSVKRNARRTPHATRQTNRPKEMTNDFECSIQVAHPGLIGFSPYRLTS